MGDRRALDKVRVLEPLLADGALERGGHHRGIRTARRSLRRSAGRSGRRAGRWRGARAPVASGRGFRALALCGTRARGRRVVPLPVAHPVARRPSTRQSRACSNKNNERQYNDKRPPIVILYGCKVKVHASYLDSSARQLSINLHTAHLSDSFLSYDSFPPILERFQQTRVLELMDGQIETDLTSWASAASL